MFEGKQQTNLHLFWSIKVDREVLFGVSHTMMATGALGPVESVQSDGMELALFWSFCMGKIATWLILPVVIRSSQRLSHACLSINLLLWNCERLIISVIVYLIVPYYLDNRSNSRANTCANTLLEWYLLDWNQPLWGDVVNHNKLADRQWRRIIQVSALSALDGKVLAYRGFNG